MQNSYPTYISAQHKRLFFFQTSSTLRNIPTNQPQHILFKNNNNSHHSITYPSYLYHPYTQLLLHHNSHTSDSFSRPPQPIPPSFHPQHPILTTSPPVNHTHQSSSFSIRHRLLAPFHFDYLYSTSQPATQRAHQAFRHTASYTFMLQDAGLHLPFYGREERPTPTFRLVGADNY